MSWGAEGKMKGERLVGGMRIREKKVLWWQVWRWDLKRGVSVEGGEPRGWQW